MKTFGILLSAAVLLMAAVVCSRQLTTQAAEPAADTAHMKMLSGDMSKDMKMMNDMMVEHLAARTKSMRSDSST